MATEGVPVNFTNTDILNAIKKRKGVVANIAKELHVSRQTIYKIINQNPDLKQAVDDERHHYEEEILDMAEHTIFHGLSLCEEDYDKAIKAAYFTLNTRGQSRGWNAVQNQQARSENIVFAIAGGKTLNDHNRSEPQASDSPQGEHG
jgi:hypothetical protein